MLAGLTEKNRKLLFQMLLIGISTAGALALPLGILDPLTIVQVVRFGGYFLIAGIFFLWLFQVVAMVRRERPGIKGLVTRHRWGIFTVVLCAAFLQLHEPHRFKVLFDEFSLLGTSREMHLQREVQVPVRAHYIDGQIQTLDGLVEKRPDFHPYLISVVHDLTGYRPDNAIYLNGFLAAVVLGLLYGILAAFWGRSTGVLAVLLFSGLPLLAQNATGGGMEVLNLAMILALMGSAAYYLSRPGTVGLNAMVLSAVVLACTRYESILYLLVVAVAVLFKWQRERQLQLTWLAALSPWLLLSPLFHHRVYMETGQLWQLSGEHSQLFSFSLLADNLALAVHYLFSFNLASTNNAALSLLGTIGLVFLLTGSRRLLASRGPDERGFLVLLLSVWTVTLANFALLMAYHWGQLDDPLVHRLTLPLYLCLTLAAVFFLREVHRPKGISLALIGASILYLLLVTVPTNARHSTTSGLLVSREFDWLRDYLEENTTEDTLVITHSAVPVITFGRAATPADDPLFQIPRLQFVLESEHYREVLLMERFELNPQTLQWENRSDPDVLRLRPYLETEFLRQVHFRPHKRTVLSRITGVRTVPESELEAPPPPPEGFENEREMLEYRLRLLP